LRNILYVIFNYAIPNSGYNIYTNEKLQKMTLTRIYWWW